MTFDVELTSLVYGGEALGRLPDGRAVFVPHALPGERVRIRLIVEKRGYARAELLEILRPSAQRISPRCAHFGVCGGCHYQHLPYDQQLAAKTAILTEQLQRVAGIERPNVAPIVPSPQEWHYRNAIQFHQAPDGRLGYHQADSNDVLPIRECHLPQPPLDELWQQLEIEPLPDLERIELRSGSGEDAMLILQSASPAAPEFSVDFPLSAVHISPAGEIILAGEDALVMEVNERAFQVSAASFFQVNTAQAGNLVHHLLQSLPLTGKPAVLEVYCGVGLFSAFLAPHCSQLVGIELSSAACQDFAINLDEFDHVALYEGAAEEILPALEFQPQIVLVDPPRAGVGQRALQAILRMAPPTIAYISCDTATLARDARHLLSAGYRLLQAAPFDMFPQTYHIESISLFQRDEPLL